MTDRRAHLRFQVMGPSPASVLTTERLRFLNIGLCGALVDAPFPLVTHAELSMQLVLHGHVSETTVKVRRVVPIDRGGAIPRYAIGLEFLSLSVEAQEVIATIVSAHRVAI
jgi:hypothetical protein